ncbi:MAG: transglycosylase domain-containing protein [Pseudorhodoplanes sp.]|jgi:monofunctional biosynthetic peptidoglycan transglycosylase|nr:transglycosylase domain-containing protein [Pseudorhodoplanes sp.]
MSNSALSLARPGAARRILRLLLVAILVIILVPYLLVPLYLVVNPVSIPMLARYATGQRVVQTNVGIGRVARILPLSVIAAEDSRFCSHYGVDWQSLRDIVSEAEDLEDLRGGSGITQQMVKNLFLWSGRSYVRKALEYPLSLWADLILPKRRIMEIYLNIAEWGPNGEFGAEAGARRAFGKSARDLSAREAALLAAVLPNPVRRNAQRPGPGVSRLAGIYQARAARSGALDDCLRRRNSRN